MPFLIEIILQLYFRIILCDVANFRLEQSDEAAVELGGWRGCALFGWARHRKGGAFWARVGWATERGATFGA